MDGETLGDLMALRPWRRGVRVDGVDADGVDVTARLRPGDRSGALYRRIYCVSDGNVWIDCAVVLDPPNYVSARIDGDWAYLLVGGVETGRRFSWRGQHELRPER